MTITNDAPMIAQDFDFSLDDIIACQRQNPDCPNEAQWRGVPKCGCFQLLMCVGCRDYVRSVIDISYAVCSHCQLHLTDENLEWKPL